MVERDDVTRWIEGYERAWASNERGDIEALFTEDARYFTAPYRKPWEGREAIVDGWLHDRDEPGQWRFASDVLAIANDLAFVQGRTEYLVEPPRTYSNLFVIRFAGDGRASEFTEWFMPIEDA